jgi:prepilin-type N-terminal cleavage/methylation domain-containing protein
MEGMNRAFIFSMTPGPSSMSGKIRLVQDRGFTLVELLVTIMIIVILATLLLPALSRAKGAAQKVKCVSNVRQILLANSMYVSDAHIYPLFAYLRDGRNYWWVDTLEPYMNARWSDPVYHCPGYPFPNEDPHHNLSSPPGGKGSYDMNPDGVYWAPYGANTDSGLTFAASIGIGGTRRGWEGLYLPLPESRVGSPSEMIAFGDAFIAGSFSGGYLRPAIYYVDSTLNSPKNRAYYWKRHNALWNIGHCDGHVESFKSAALFERSDRALRRWNYDNKPHTEFFPPP